MCSANMLKWSDLERLTDCPRSPRRSWSIQLPMFWWFIQLWHNHGLLTCFTHIQWLFHQRGWNAKTWLQTYWYQLILRQIILILLIIISSFHISWVLFPIHEFGSRHEVPNDRHIWVCFSCRTVEQCKMDSMIYNDLCIYTSCWFICIHCFCLFLKCVYIYTYI